MSKGLLYKLFGVGRIPQYLLTEMQAELIEVSDEGVKGSVTYKNFKAPGKRDNWRRVWFSGSIAVTGTRLVGLRYGNFAINVPWIDERLKQMSFSIEKAALLIEFDASLFQPTWSGQLEYRFRSDLSDKILEAIHRHLN